MEKVYNKSTIYENNKSTIYENNKSTIYENLYDIIVVGVGLAGLGIVDGLVSNGFTGSILMVDKETPKFDGNDRFNTSIGASFKNNGILNTTSTEPGIKKYFAKETLRIYKERNVQLKETDQLVLSSSRKGMENDVFLDKITKDDLQKFEPHIKFSKKLKGTYKFPKEYIFYYFFVIFS